jgi:hypothetical protein
MVTLKIFGIAVIVVFVCVIVIKVINIFKDKTNKTKIKNDVSNTIDTATEALKTTNKKIDTAVISIDNVVNKTVKLKTDISVSNNASNNSQIKQAEAAGFVKKENS